MDRCESRTACLTQISTSLSMKLRIQSWRWGVGERTRVSVLYLLNGDSAVGTHITNDLLHLFPKALLQSSASRKAQKKKKKKVSWNSNGFLKWEFNNKKRYRFSTFSYLCFPPARLPRPWRVQPGRRWRPKLQSKSILLSFLFSKKILTDIGGPKEQMVKNPSIPAVWGPVWPTWIPPNLMSDWDFAAQ